MKFMSERRERFILTDRAWRRGEEFRITETKRGQNARQLVDFIKSASFRSMPPIRNQNNAASKHYSVELGKKVE